MKRTLLAGVLLTAMMTSGCYSLTVKADTNSPVLLNNPAKLATGKHFSTQATAGFFLYGLVGDNSKAISNAIVKELGTNKGIVNLKVTKETGVGDYVFSALTAGIYTPRTFRIEGDLVN